MYMILFSAKNKDEEDEEFSDDEDEPISAAQYLGHGVSGMMEKH